MVCICLENKYIVKNDFMSREEMTESKYAIFVPNQSDLCLPSSKMEGHPYKVIASDSKCCRIKM